MRVWTRARSVRPWSRRRFLGALGALSGAALVAACSQPSASTPAKPAESQAGRVEARRARGSGARRQPGQPHGRRRLRSLPTSQPLHAAAAAPRREPKVVSGVFNVWFSANWNTVTDEAIGGAFVEWGKANGGQKVEWQSIPGSPQLLAKQSAALAAGQPPEVVQRQHGLLVQPGRDGDIKDLVNKFKDKAGGMYEIALTSLTASDGGDLRGPVRDRRLAAAVADRRDRRGQQRQVLRDLGPVDRAWPEGPEAAPDATRSPFASATKATT